MEIVTVQRPAGDISSWQRVEQSGARSPLTGDEWSAYIGQTLIQEVAGIHNPAWSGVRLYRTAAGGSLAALHNGWWLPSDGVGVIDAIEAAQEGCALDDPRLAPRTPEGRRRDHTSASQASRWLSCPGSVRLCDEVALPRASSAYAKEGTAAHEMAENALIFGTNAAPLVGTISAEGVEITQDMVEHVDLYLATVRSDQAKYGGEILVENDVLLPVGNTHMRGTLDAMLWSPDTKTLRVYDLKYGAGVVVDVEDNPQLRIYGLGGMVAIQKDAGPMVEHVEMVIVQPRRATENSEGDDGRVRREMLTAKEMSDWYSGTLVPGVERIGQSDAEFVPSEKGCRWCPANYCCPALADKSLTAAREAFGDATLENPPAPLPTKKADVKEVKMKLEALAADLSPERTATILAISPLVTLWLKVVSEHAHTQLQHGKPVPGYKLIGKVGNRKWSKPDAEVVKEITDATNTKPSACFAPPKILSPAQMEKKLGKDARPIVAELTHRPDTGTAMVPESDKRPAIDCDPSAVFSVID